MSHDLLAFGNPLLDIIIKCDSDTQLITKYKLLPDGAVEAEPWQMALFDEVFQCEHQLKPGGSAQNTCRVARSFLNDESIKIIFMGCVGKDNYAKILKELVEKSGVTALYMCDETEPTGISAALVHGPYRSLCANIGAAKRFQVNHLARPEVKDAMSTSSILYIEGYFLTHSPNSARFLAEFVTTNHKTLSLNLSAVYICREFGHELSSLMPYTHLVVGNEDEVAEFSRQSSITATDCAEIVAKLSELEFKGTLSSFNLFGNFQRCVVMTRGSKSILVALGNKVREFPVPHIPKENLVDTVGAGDAFVGGFLAAMIGGGDLNSCVELGMRASSEVIQRDGCSV